MGYHPDLEKISIEEFGKKLSSAYLPPSRKLLLNNIEENFLYFRRAGMTNLKELRACLKNKACLENVSADSGIPEEYLKVLLREINSWLPKPNRIRDFINVEPEILTRLEAAGVGDTRKLFELAGNEKARQALASSVKIPLAAVNELAHLSDISRIKWVGAAFARMLYDLGYDSVVKIRSASAEELHDNLNRLNEEKAYFKGKIGLNDIRILIQAAGEVEEEIKF